MDTRRAGPSSRTSVMAFPSRYSGFRYPPRSRRESVFPERSGVKTGRADGSIRGDAWKPGAETPRTAHRTVPGRSSAVGMLLCRLRNAPDEARASGTCSRPTRPPSAATARSNRRPATRARKPNHGRIQETDRVQRIARPPPLRNGRGCRAATSKHSPDLAVDDGFDREIRARRQIAPNRPGNKPPGPLLRFRAGCRSSMPRSRPDSAKGQACEEHRKAVCRNRAARPALVAETVPGARSWRPRTGKPIRGGGYRLVPAHIAKLAIARRCADGHESWPYGGRDGHSG